MIKTFSGLMSDGAQETIHLRTLTGSTGYKIIKFQMMPEKPGTTDYEHIMKVFKTAQTTVTENINFSDSLLLAAGYTEGGAATNFIGNPMTVIFDQDIINQDIHITHIDTKGALACNYYLELEQVKLDSNETAVATLKNIKNRG
jgi:hypothetical protein